VVPVLNYHSPLDQMIGTIPHLAQGGRPVLMNHSLPALPSPGCSDPAVFGWEYRWWWR
jgi:hypothetical protein